MKLSLLAITTLIFTFASIAQKDKDDEKEKGLSSSTVSGLKFRLVGPALTSGRISDIAVDPENEHKWFVATASGGLWKTVNHGTTFSPIFDSQKSFSIGCVTIAPSNNNVVWVGTGENNNQRSVAYGDGVYKSVDGGKSFKNMGLKDSEHIGKIIVHPEDENTIWVAAYGPVWSKGGERGVYKSTDGGETWTQTLEISEHTGVSEIAIDPSNPDILYAAAHQRRRREWTYIGGGPESGMYKSNDGGETWKNINKGLPEENMGRIGIAVSPVNPDYVYVIVEARQDKGGFFRSTNKGENWSKMSDYKTSGNYYQEIICDLTDVDKVFSMNTYLHHTEDGGKTFKRTGESKKHVDNHCIWIDPKNPDHWIVGCDGGIYETYTHAKQWRYYDNLPLIQFYKVATDNDSPFYNIYGGTQDNNSMGGPSATASSAGILNSDWYITNGGDGFESQIDPLDPNIAYAQAQYGWLIRYDRQSGEKTPIQPMPAVGEAPYRWNWDAPLLISPHDNKTLYFCANKVFKTTNQGDDWKSISNDLSRGIDRNKLPVMDQVWSIEAVMKNKSTTIYGNIVAFDESPKKQGLLYAGTDDGLIWNSPDGGGSWSKVETFSGVPDMTRVNMICADVHDENTVYAVFNNHRSGDFKPYIYKSTDKGKTWTSISGDLPERGSAHVIRQDHVDPNLLFCGTDFGAYFSNNGGKNWHKLGGLPTIAVLDLDIQKRENDLVAATFGRGFYVLDNYTPLRDLSEATLDKKAHIFPIKDAMLYVPASPLGWGGTGSHGHALWTADNPKFGATFSLYLKETGSSLKSDRLKAEKEKEKNKEAVDYPSFDDLKAEDQEGRELLVWIIKTNAGEEVQRILTSPKKGVSRTTWNLRMRSTSPLGKKSESGGDGFLIQSGNYTVEVYSVKDGKVEQLVGPTSFEVKNYDNLSLPNGNPSEHEEFHLAVDEVNRKVDGSGKLMQEMEDKVKYIERALLIYPGTELQLLSETERLTNDLYDCRVMLYGDPIPGRHEFESSPGISSRLSRIQWTRYSSRSAVTQTQRRNLEMAESEYTNFRARLDDIIKRISALEDSLNEKDIPYIPGQDESWKEE